MRLKLITVNIWLGGKLWDELVEFLRQQDADIVAMQEVYNGDDATLPRELRSFDELRKVLPYEHAAFAPAYRDGRCQNIEIGQAVFSKFPIDLNEAIWFDIPFERPAGSYEGTGEFTPRSLQHCTIRANGTVIDIFNIHGIWGNRDGDDNPRRFAMIDTTLQAMNGKQPAILAGDFNLKNTTQAVAQLRNKLNDVFGDDLASTYNMQQKIDPGYATAVCDMIFVTPDVKVIEKQCPTVNASDHFPLVATLEL